MSTTEAIFNETGPSQTVDSLSHHISKYHVLINAYQNKINETNSQYELDSVYDDIKALYHTINGELRKTMPKKWTPLPVFQQNEIYKRRCEGIERDNEKQLRDYEIRKEKAKESFRNAISAMKKRKAEAERKGEKYNGKFIREKEVKRPKLKPMPKPIESEVPVNANFRKNYMRRARRRNRVKKMPQRHLIPVVTSNDRRKEKKKQARILAWKRKNGIESV